MGEEVELEGRPQIGFGQAGDGTGPGGAGVADHHIEASELLAHPRDRVAHLLAIGDITGQAKGPRTAGGRRRPDGLAIEVQQGQLSPLGGEGPGRGRADGASAAGDQHHLAGQGLLGALAELGLLQAPVLHVEGVVLAHRLEAADALGRQQRAGPGLADVSRHGRLSGALADADQPQPGNGDQPRQGIEHRLMAADPGVLTLEVAPVLRRVGLQRRLDRRRRGIGRQQQRPGLGADHVVRGGHTALHPVRQALVVDHGAGQGGVAQRQEPAAASAAGFGGPAQGTAQLRQQRRRRSGALRHGYGVERALSLFQARFGLPHQLDHPPIALLGRGAEGKEAVLEQHHALGLLSPCQGRLVGVGAGLGQGEARHHIRHQHHPLAVDLAADPLGVGLIGQGQQRRGVGVIHKGVRQEGVQQRLH